MSLKKVKCPACGTRNWSGSVYCEKCSGPLYREKESLNNTLPTLSLSRIFS